MVRMLDHQVTGGSNEEKPRQPIANWRQALVTSRDGIVADEMGKRPCPDSAIVLMRAGLLFAVPGDSVHRIVASV